MSCETEYLVYLYGCGALGITPDASRKPLDAARLSQLAEKHSVNGVISMALKNASFLSEDRRSEYAKISVINALSNNVKIGGMQEVLGQLEAKGLHPVVLKGADIARLYRYPECRSSADCDLFVPESEENAALDVMKELGFEVEPRKKGFYHSEAIHPVYGLFEIHVNYWHDDLSDAVFGKENNELAEPSDLKKVDFCGSEITVVNGHDALMFLAVHLVKHFISTGMNIRQAFDFALYYSVSAKEEDASRFVEDAKKYGFFDFLQIVCSVFVRAGCFTQDEFPYMQTASEEECELIFKEFDGYVPSGILFDKTWNYYRFNHYERANTLELESEKLQFRVKRFFEELFPSAQFLAGRYPFMRDKKYLYPVAWLRRTVKGLTVRRKLRNALGIFRLPTQAQVDSDAYSDDEIERIRLLKLVNLLKK